MDRLLEQSDSDSGESWTLLESSPAFADEPPDFEEPQVESPTTENHERDEDTDGISIISDSDHEIHIGNENFISDTMSPIEQDIPQFVSVDQHLSNFKNNKILVDEHDFLGDNNKHKIYVHRRNKRLSTVLNIIMLGSVITAAGVAIGHMWGAKNDCSVQNPPSVNKILSNLYKLQEENAYLRSKLKELSQYHQSLVPVKQNRCKKVFEEPLGSQNVNQITKCLDEGNKNTLQSHLIEPVFEKEFLDDLKNIENIYQKNKNWLDNEITKRLRDEKSKSTNNHQSDIISNKQSKDIFPNEPFVKISYADSLKSNNYSKKNYKREVDKFFESKLKSEFKKKLKSNDEKYSQQTISDQEITKDDWYIKQRNKEDKKKYNHHKSLRKQKRRNKYQQWEMKTGYIKDYDDLPSSLQDLKVTSDSASEQNVSSQSKLTNVSDTILKSTVSDKQKKKKTKKGTQDNWYEKRVDLRKEARQKLEQELFGETATNTARWYFRRMKKREQCRTKDNSTYQKQYDKRTMNYKMKH
ncbi:unnamed protein product [Leptosia nina]|uniref:Uncharacterized protein n=1 Tax=Leptosia nina TaxID=320188 RepID=A0AAV1J0V2_9NEOP